MATWCPSFSGSQGPVSVTTKTVSDSRKPDASTAHTFHVPALGSGLRKKSVHPDSKPSSGPDLRDVADHVPSSDSMWKSMPSLGLASASRVLIRIWVMPQLGSKVMPALTKGNPAGAAGTPADGGAPLTKTTVATWWPVPVGSQLWASVTTSTKGDTRLPASSITQANQGSATASCLSTTLVQPGSLPSWPVGAATQAQPPALAATITLTLLMKTPE